MPIIPVVTEITGSVATWDASGFIDAIATHVNSGAATHTNRDAYNAGEGVTISFADPGEGQQVNLRKTAADQIHISIEPTGSITNPGDSVGTSVLGTSAQWSGEINTVDVNGTAGHGAGAKAYFIEVPDAFFFLTIDTTLTFNPLSIHAGRVYQTILSANAESLGQDGLGWLAGGPVPGNTGSISWLGNGTASAMRWSSQEWYDNVNIWTGLSTAQAADATSSSVLYPVAPAIIYMQNIGSGFQDPIFGLLKYVKGANTNEPPLTVIPDTGSNQAWLYVHRTSSSVPVVIVWNKTVTP